MLNSVFLRPRYTIYIHTHILHILIHSSVRVAADGCYCFVLFLFILICANPFCVLFFNCVTGNVGFMRDTLTLPLYLHKYEPVSMCVLITAPKMKKTMDLLYLFQFISIKVSFSHVGAGERDVSERISADTYICRRDWQVGRGSEPNWQRF